MICIHYCVCVFSSPLFCLCLIFFPTDGISVRGLNQPSICIRSAHFLFLDFPLFLRFCIRKPQKISKDYFWTLDSLVFQLFLSCFFQCVGVGNCSQSWIRFLFKEFPPLKSFFQKVWSERFFNFFSSVSFPISCEWFSFNLYEQTNIFWDQHFRASLCLFSSFSLFSPVINKFFCTSSFTKG